MLWALNPRTLRPELLNLPPEVKQLQKLQVEAAQARARILRGFDSEVAAGR